MQLKIEDKIAIYERIYFTFDKPVPFKDDLMIYPATVKDYFRFYDVISCFTVDKNNDPSGVGLSMSDLKYAFHLMKQPNSGYQEQFINLLELIFHIENGLYCDNVNCSHQKEIHSYVDIRPKVVQFQKDLIEKYKGVPDSERLITIEKQKQLYEMQKCPCCGELMKDVFEFKEENKKSLLYIKGIELDAKDYKELKKIYCHQNLPNYDDEYIDPELKAGLEEASRLKSGNTEQPTLERQMSCIVASSGYTYEALQDVSLRKFTNLLRVADSKISYLAYKIGEMSGLVTFKNPYPHWIYTKENARKSMFENIMSVEQIEKKIGNSGITQ